MIDSPIYKNLKDIPLVTVVTVGIMSITGGIYNYMKSVDNKKNRARLFLFNTIASFGIGSMMFLACAGYGLNEVFSAGVASASAYIGTRMFTIFELFMAKKLGLNEVVDNVKDEL